MPGCKVGDIAYHNRDCAGGKRGLYGKIVSIVRRKDAEKGLAWIIDPPLHPDVKKFNVISKGNWVYDKHLNPIRDQPGEDEMLRIAGKPKEIENV